MRLIDADALLQNWKSLWGGDEEYVETIRYKIADAPTVDAVPVVRCEQCKSLEANAKLLYSASDGRKTDDYWSHELDRNVYTIGFCGYGAKMENIEGDKERA